MLIYQAGQRLTWAQYVSWKTVSRGTKSENNSFAVNDELTCDYIVCDINGAQ